MDSVMAAKRTREEQCKINAREKSEKKRRAAYEALSILRKEKRPVTKAAVAKRAGVSVVFLRSHLDLTQAIEEAEKSWITSSPIPTSRDNAKDQVNAALHRRLEKLKEDLAKKDAIIRQKQREIDTLYGKLAACSVLTDVDLRQKLQETLKRVAALESQMEEQK
jgi:hypothetical protein